MGALTSCAHRRGLQDEERCRSLTAEFDGVYVDYSRQRVTPQTMSLLGRLAEAADVKGKISAMAGGKHLNVTEDRAVGHMALRAPKGATMMIDGVNAVADVHAVLDRISDFAHKVRSGAWVGATGKPLTAVVSIGIGSYLGVEYVYEALRKDATAGEEGRRPDCCWDEGNGREGKGWLLLTLTLCAYCLWRNKIPCN